MRGDTGDFDAFVTELRALFLTLRGLSEELHASSGCSAPERGVLMKLLAGADTVPRMARSRNVSRQAMQKTVDHMIERKWVRAIPNPEHRSSPLVQLQAAGREVLALVRAREAEAFARMRLPVTNDELEDATVTLEKLRVFFANTTRRRRSAAG